MPRPILEPPTPMKTFITDLLKSYEFHSFGDFIQSLVPSLKYGGTFFLFSFSAVVALMQQITGLQAMAVIAFVVIMLAELVTGVKASQVEKGAFNFNTRRFSRFALKLFSYFALLFFCNAMSLNYEVAGKTLTAGTFEWLHTYLVVHIGFENVMSILENIAVIEGKPKAYYLEKIKNRLSLFK